ncbi:MAG: type II toxin-antitoxin system RelE/ParE family toxin [Nitrospiraceae bacterium]|nr:MAG: type II toxin-antitoxin system RelE/ParE family toxin [Nitrospiraceae bacterium]
MYSFEIKDELEKSLRKLAKRDNQLYEAATKKILQIAENPVIGKPLRNVLKGKKRVHIGHFVLIFSVDDKERKVTFLEFDHHDNVYK